MTDQDSENLPLNDELGQRQPPPYPGLTKGWQQQPAYSQSFSGSEAGMETLSSTENLSFPARQDPQGEETARILQGFGDGNPPPGGGIGGWSSSPGLSGSKASLNSGASVDVAMPSLCVTGDVEPSLNDETGVDARVVTDCSSEIFLSQSPIGQPPSYASAQSTTGHSAGQTGTGVASTSVSPLLMRSSNSLISQLLLCSSENSHLRNLLQNRCAHGSATEAESKAPTENSDDSKKLPYEQMVSIEGSCNQPPVPSSTAGISSEGHGSGGKTTGGSPKSRTGRVSRTSGSPKGGAESRSVRSRHSVMQTVSGGSTVAAQSRSGAPVRDLQRPSTAPSAHQLAAAASGVRFAGNESCLESSAADSEMKTCVGSQPDLTRAVEVASSWNGVAQGASAKVVTSVRGRELMRLSSYSAVQQPSQYLLPTPKQAPSPQSSATKRQSAKHSSQKKHLPDLDHAAIATRATEMVERLSEENQALRQELRSYYKKVSTLEKVEREIRKVSDAYEVLVLHSQKRENLEKLMRYKLETEIQNMSEINKQLKEHLERSMLQLQQKQGHCAPELELKRELRRQDALIAKLIVKNRELEMETSAQHSNLQSQSKQIRFLQNALSEQQMDVSRCEEELEGHRAGHHRGSDLQLTISEFQLMGDKCEGVAERRLGAKMDEEYHVLRNQQCDTDDGISSDSESPTSIHSLIRQMQEKERRILQLEAEVAKWEQKFVDEAIFRQLAVEAISVPKDGRAVSSEPNLVDDFHCRTRVSSDRAMQLKEVYEASLHIVKKKEMRLARALILIRNLQAELAEKEMLIKMLQHHASLSRSSSSISSLLLPSASSPPLHSPHHRSPTRTAYMMSMSVPASGATSRQSSQVDDDHVYVCTSREPVDQHPMHVKSNSATGILGNGYSAPSVHSLELQYQASPQVLSYGSSQSLQSGCDQMKHCLWHV